MQGEEHEHDVEHVGIENGRRVEQQSATEDISREIQIAGIL